MAPEPDAFASMTYPEALAYLRTFVNFERMPNLPYKTSFKLDRFITFLELLGNPHHRLRLAHVAGTNGKGSVCAFLYAVLRCAGYRVGLYTSPHLSDMRERIVMGDGAFGEEALGPREWISEELLTELVAGLRPVVERFHRESSHGELTYFEVMTALAFLAFVREQVDIAVLETGLGGRLDATNVVTPLVCGLTPIHLEHTAFLGSTLSEIAREKVGILKTGVPACVARQSREAFDVIERAAVERDVPLWRVGQELLWVDDGAGPDGQRFSATLPSVRLPGLSTFMLGAHQCENALLALGLAARLSERSGLQVSEDAMRRGVQLARWPGRMEWVGTAPRILLDGAQNPSGLEALAQALRRHRLDRHLVGVFGVSSDKDAERMLKVLLPCCEHVIVTAAGHPRATPPERLRRIAQTLGRDVVDAPTPADALTRARMLAAPDGTVLVAGSLFLVGAVRQAVRGASTGNGS